MYILKLIGTEGTNRLYSFVQFETNGTKGTKSIVSDLVNILKMTLRFVQCVQFETDGNTWTKSIVSDQVNFLKMIGLKGTLRFVLCVQFCTVFSISYSSVSVNHIHYTSHTYLTFLSATRGFPTLLSMAGFYSIQFL